MIGSLPAGWTARSTVEPVRLDARRRPRSVRAPGPTRPGTYHVDVSGHEPGPRPDHDRARRRRERPADGPAAAIAIVGKADDRDRRRAPAVVSWPAATDPTSAIAGYELQIRSVDGGAWYGGRRRPPAPSARSDAASRSTPRYRYRRPRARRAGNWSPWVATAPFRAALVDDRSASVKYTRHVDADPLRRRAIERHARHARRDAAPGSAARSAAAAIAVVAPRGPAAATVARLHRRRLPAGPSTFAARRSHQPPGRLSPTTFASSGTHTIELASSRQRPGRPRRVRHPRRQLLTPVTRVAADGLAAPATVRYA